MKWLIQFFITLIALQTVSHGAVWQHSSLKKWNQDWENKYSQWVQQSVDENWLQRKENPFYNWHLDCAKFAYLLKIYFASQNQLEFAIHNPSSKTEIISSLSNQWDSISDPVQRLKAFTKHILAQVNTRTLPKDSVLLAITKETLIPGAILLSDAQRAHTMILKNMKDNGFPTFIFATLPASEYLYLSYAYPAPEVYFPSRVVPNRNTGGFRRLKWPEELRKSTPELLFSSNKNIFSFHLDQEYLNYETFFEEVQKKIQIQPHTINDKMDYLLEDLCMKLRIRVNIIIDAGHALRKLQGGSFTKEQIDLYSTYSRDKDILKAFNNVDTFYSLNEKQLHPELVDKIKTLLQPQGNSEDYCWVQWADNRIEPLGVLRQKFKSQKISSDPYSSFAQRWGE